MAAPQYTTAQDDVIVQLDGGIAVRRYRDSDVESIAHHANNMKVKKNMRDRFPYPYTKEVAMTWIKLTRDAENQARSGHWTIERGADGPLIPTNYTITVNDEAVGGIGLEFGRDVYFRSAEIGYWLGEEHWGKGVMSKVLKRFVLWAWDTFGILVRLNGAAFEWNAPSQAILNKTGFVYEGRQESKVFRNGKLSAELMFGALRPA